jgi:hypothetical protein
MCNCAVKKLVLVSVILTLWSQAISSQPRSCSSVESEKADREASRLRTWDALYQSYHRFAHCDDGSIAEGYSESVARILADRWDTLPRISVLSANDQQFQKFVLRHIDATLDTNDVKKIRRNAIHRCPSGEDDFCRQVKTAADKALKEME